MTPTFTEGVQAGWGRLLGAFVGGVAAALALTSLGDNPLNAALSYVVTMLMLEMLQWKASYLSASLLFSLLFVDKPHGQYPWHFIYDRVVYNFIGVLIGILIMAFFWPDKPRVALSNHLGQILRDTDRGFRAIVCTHMQGELPSAELETHLHQMQALVQESQSLLDKLSYGIAADLFIQDNWSELIAAQGRLVRYLSWMGQTFSFEGKSLLWQHFTAPLTHLVEQVSLVCTTLASLIPSRSANQPQFDIPLLSRDVSEIVEQLRQLRTTQEFLALPAADILRFYGFLDALSHFTEQLQQIAQHLHERQAVNRQKRRIGLSFKLHPLQGDTFKQYLKGGLILGTISALQNYFDLFDIKRWALFFAITAIAMIQPAWGVTIDIARSTTLSFIPMLALCYLLIKTMGTSAVTIALGLFAVSYFCLKLKLVAGFQLSIKNALVFMLIMPPNSPTLYVDFWNILKNALAGVLLALLISRLFWPASTTQKVEFSISQTLTKLGQLYQTLIKNYLQGIDTSGLTPLTQTIQQSIQTQVSLQAFTAHEVLDNEIVSQTHQRWNFIISYEKKLLYNLLSLQDAIHYHNSDQFAQALLLELQGLARPTAQAFKDLGAAVGSEVSQKEFPELLAAIDVVRQRLENFIIQGGSREFTEEAAIAFSSILLLVKEIAENLNQMAQDWPSSYPARI